MLGEGVLYVLLYSLTDRPIVKFLGIFPATFPDTYGGKLTNTCIYTSPTGS